jgi:glycosyltransferase involved in cell wall biosynthesis
MEKATVTDRGQPGISVLLPAFNVSRTLPACLSSIERQTRTDWECWIVDDGSSDDTLRIARRHAESDDRFRVLPCLHRGIVAALNTGLTRCRGRWVARMDADDLMHSGRLEQQVNLLESQPDLVAVGCHVRIFPRATLRPGRRAYERWLNGVEDPEGVRRDAFVECPLAHPTWMIDRPTLIRFGYRDRGWPEDYDLLLRLLAVGHSIGVLTERRLLWRNHPARLSRTTAAYSIDRFTACKAHHLTSGFLAEHSDYVLWGHGGTGRALKRALAALGRHPSYVVELHPGRLGNRIGRAPVIPPDALVGIPKRPIIVSVAGTEARTQIRAALASMGFSETLDYICAA